MDKLNSAERSRNMARIRGKDTTPEKRVRSLLHRMGCRFRLHDARLPGKPDIVLPKHRAVIFVHGCFWHRHEGCKRATMPSNNREFWEKKLTLNRERDRRHLAELAALGYRCLVVWQCELKDMEALRQRLASFLATQAERGDGEAGETR